MSEELKRAQRHDLAGSLVVLQVDRLADVHRDHGFRAGDALLRGMIEALRDGTRAHDLLAGTGDAEFALLLRHIDEQSAGSCVLRLLSACERLEVGRIRGISVSAGIADFKTPSRSSTKRERHCRMRARPAADEPWRVVEGATLGPRCRRGDPAP